MKRGKTKRSNKRQLSLMLWLVTTIILLLFLSYIQFYREEKITGNSFFDQLFPKLTPTAEQTQVTNPEEVAQKFIVSLNLEETSKYKFDRENFGTAILPDNEVAFLISLKQWQEQNPYDKISDSQVQETAQSVYSQLNPNNVQLSQDQIQQTVQDNSQLLTQEQINYVAEIIYKLQPEKPDKDKLVKIIEKAVEKKWLDYEIAKIVEQSKQVLQQEIETFRKENIMLDKKQIDALVAWQTIKIQDEQQQVINFLRPNQIIGDVHKVANAMLIKVTAQECLKLVEQGLIKQCTQDIPLSPTMDAILDLNVKKIIDLNKNTNPNYNPPFGRISVGNGGGVTIIFIDTGFDHRNTLFGDPPELRVKTNLECFIEPEQGAFSCGNYFAQQNVEEEDHGTLVASVAVADDPENYYDGIAPAAYILPISVEGWISHLTLVLDKLVDYKEDNLIDPDKAVISSSLSAMMIKGCQGRAELPSLFSSLNNIYNEGFIYVQAAGNCLDYNEDCSSFRKSWTEVETGPCTIEVPGDSPKVIAVGASTKAEHLQDERLEHYSSRGGLNELGEYLRKPDLVATTPKFIKIVLQNGTVYYWPYVACGGTSCATPVVSGTVALIESIAPFLDKEQIKRTLILSGTVNLDNDNGQWYSQYDQGEGRLSIHKVFSAIDDYVIAGGGGPTKAPSIPNTQDPWYKSQCTDDIDNDNDGGEDYTSDGKCANAYTDNVEYDLPTCGNGKKEPDLGETKDNCCQDMGTYYDKYCVNNVVIPRSPQRFSLEIPYSQAKYYQNRDLVTSVKDVVNFKGSIVYTSDLPYCYRIRSRYYNGVNWENPSDLLPGTYRQYAIEDYYVALGWDTTKLRDTDYNDIYNITLETGIPVTQNGQYSCDPSVVNYHIGNYSYVTIDNNYFIEQGPVKEYNNEKIMVFNPSIEPEAYIYGNIASYGLNHFALGITRGITMIDNDIGGWLTETNNGQGGINDNIIGMLNVQGLYETYCPGFYKLYLGLNSTLYYPNLGVYGWRVYASDKSYYGNDAIDIWISEPSICNNCAQCTAALNDPYTTHIKLNQNITSSGDCINSRLVVNKTFDCQGFTIQGISSGQGINIQDSSDYKIKNCIIKDFREGIEVDDSYNISIDNIIVNNSYYSGIWVHGTSYNINITNSVSSYNGDNGINLNPVYSENPTNIKIIDNTLLNNENNGLKLHRISGITQDNLVQSNKICDNEDYDLHISDSTLTVSYNFYTTITSSNSNIIYNFNHLCACTCNSCSDCQSKLINQACATVYLANDISSTGTCINTQNYVSNKVLDCSGYTISGPGTDFDYGILLGSGSNYNTIRNCKIKGFYKAISVNTRGNLIYNNLFNGTVEVYMASGPNSWNIEKTLGTNIINGNYIGGNFYAMPNGRGYSETCIDGNGDGICDSSHVLDDNPNNLNIDYLPLTKLTTVQLSECEAQGGICSENCLEGYSPREFSCSLGGISNPLEVCCMPETQTPESENWGIFDFLRV